MSFKADGPSGDGSLWVATNQCLGGSTSCVNIAERLNRQLRQCKSNKVQPIDSTAFSVAMNGTEARLYISWKHDELNYYMRNVESFLLHRPDHYLEFRKFVRNIVDWGKDKYLKEIRASLDNLLEESRRRTSEAAKSRPVPSVDFVNSNRDKQKASRKEKTSNQSPVFALPTHQQLPTSDRGYRTDAPQPVTSVYGYTSSDPLEPVTSVNEYNAISAPHVIIADGTYGPNTLYVQTTDSEYFTPHVSTRSPNTPYSSENLPDTSSTEIDEAHPVERSRKVDSSKSRKPRRKRYR